MYFVFVGLVAAGLTFAAHEHAASRLGIAFLFVVMIGVAHIIGGALLSRRFIKVFGPSMAPLALMPFGIFMGVGFLVALGVVTHLLIADAFWLRLCIGLPFVVIPACFHVGFVVRKSNREHGPRE